MLLGRTWRVTIRHLPAPRERAASTYSLSRTDRIELRSRRATVAQLKMPRARTTGMRPRPTTRTITMAPMMQGEGEEDVGDRA